MKVIAYVPELNRETEVELSYCAMQAVYRKVELEYRMDDAKNHVEYAGYDPDGFSETDYEEMAQLFAKRCDCDIDENSTWESVVKEYIEDKGVA